ncbi:hypothetical protein V6N13_020036 [Hibiscus sabdariffa]
MTWLNPPFGPSPCGRPTVTILRLAPSLLPLVLTDLVKEKILLPTIKAPVAILGSRNLNIPHTQQPLTLASTVELLNFDHQLCLLARVEYGSVGKNEDNPPNMVKLESKLQQELEFLLDQEELLWKQKVCSYWINFSDRNTKYFHAKVVSKRRHSRISMLRISNGEW